MRNITATITTITTITTIALLFATESARCQNSVVAPRAGPATAGPMGVAGPAVAGPAQGQPEAKPAAKPMPSTPASRSAAALALSSEPTFDEGTAQRIREAALSYSALAVRGGWPTIPADAKFAWGVRGPHDDLLRARLIVSGDLDADQLSGAYDDFFAAGVKRFQERHGLVSSG